MDSCLDDSLVVYSLNQFEILFTDLSGFWVRRLVEFVCGLYVWMWDVVLSVVAIWLAAILCV